MPLSGFLSAASPSSYAHFVRAFRQGLSETDYAEGRNVAIKFGWAEGRYDRLPNLAAGLVDSQVAVMVVGGAPAAGSGRAWPSRQP